MTTTVGNGSTAAWSKVTGNNWDAGLVTINADSNFLGYGLAVGIGPVILHWVNDFGLQNTLVGAEASVMGLGLSSAYGNTATTPLNYGPATSDRPEPNKPCQIEAKLRCAELMLSPLTLEWFFGAICRSEWAFGGDLTVGYQMFKFVLGATTTSTYVTAALLWDAMDHRRRTSASTSGSRAYMDGAPPAASALQAVDIGATYEFGTFKLIVG